MVNLGAFFALLGQVWYGYVFAAIVIAIGILSNKGVLRTPLSVSHPAFGTAMILVALPFVYLPPIFAYHALLVDGGEPILAIIYPAIVSMFLFLGVALYLGFAVFPPAFLIPRWVAETRASAGPRWRSPGGRRGKAGRR